MIVVAIYEVRRPIGFVRVVAVLCGKGSVSDAASKAAITHNGTAAPIGKTSGVA